MITKLGVTLGLAILFAAPCFAQDAASQKFLKEALAFPILRASGSAPPWWGWCLAGAPD